MHKDNMLLYDNFINHEIFLHENICNTNIATKQHFYSICLFKNIMLFLQAPNHAMRLFTSPIKSFNIFEFQYISNMYIMKHAYYLLSLLDVEFNFYNIKYCHYLVLKFYYKIISHALYMCKTAL